MTTEVLVSKTRVRAGKEMVTMLASMVAMRVTVQTVARTHHL